MWETARRAPERLLAGPYGLVYLGLVGYCAAVTSYQLPAQLPMAVAAVALVGGALFQTKRFTLGSAPGALLLLYTVFVAFSVPMSILKAFKKSPN
jgi:hypothetical protein